MLDFGVAKAAGRLQTTREGQVKGKLAYMAPEQLRAKAVDRRTDVFAASVVLWEALTGRRLFGGNTQEDIVTQILEGRVETPSEAVSKEEADESSLAMIRALDAVTLKGLSLPRRRSLRLRAGDGAGDPEGARAHREARGHRGGGRVGGRVREGGSRQACEGGGRDQTISSVGPESMRAIRDNRVELADAATARAAGGSDPRSSARASDSSGVKSAPVNPAITSVAAPAARRTGRSIVLPLAAGGIGLALGFVLLGLSRTSPTGSIRSRHASISGALAQLAPPVTATPPLSDASEGAVAPSARSHRGLPRERGIPVRRPPPRARGPRAATRPTASTRRASSTSSRSACRRSSRVLVLRRAGVRCRAVSCARATGRLQHTVTQPVDPLRSAVAVLVPFATVPAMLVVPLSHMPDQSWNPETGVAEIDTLLPLRHTVCCDAVDGVPLPMVTVRQEITLLTVSSVPLQPLPLPDPELEDNIGAAALWNSRCSRSRSSRCCSRSASRSWMTTC